MKNPLDKFQSHSVHYVMLAARSTEDVRRFTIDSQQAQSETLSAIDAARQLGDVVRVGDSTEAFLMMDTRRFSQYGISDFELDTMLAGFAVPGSKGPNSTAIGMKFTVVDSMGISFANFLQYLMDQKLQVSFDGMTVLVRVLFIGHKSDGSTEVVQSLTIPAIFNQIQMDLNEVKGLYHCTLFPMIGMASNSSMNRKWTTIGTASSYFSGTAANTLGAIVTAFERKLNEESIKRYTQLNAQTQQDGVKTTVGRYGRPVQFMITLPNGWDAFPFSGPSQGNAVETVFTELVKKEKEAAQTTAEAQKKTQQNANAPAKDSYVTVDPSLSITEVLDEIFKQCLDVAKLGNFTHKQDTDGSLRFYKHLITVTSDNDSFTVHIDVVEFLVPNVDLATNSGGAVAPNDQDIYTKTTMPDGSVKMTPKQYFEYDYIFSGKNLDVLSLDIKIENLNVLLMQGSKLGQGQLWQNATNGQKQTDGTSVAKDEHPVYGRRAKDPALLPARSGADKTNYSNLAGNAKTDGDASPQALNQQYVQNLQAFYAAGPVDTKMVLRGNPDLMVMVSLQSIPQHVSAVTITSDGGVVSKTNQSVKSAYRAAFEKDLLRLNGISDGQSGGVNYSNEGRKAASSPISTQMLTGRNFVSGPVFAKVNVYGPNVDFLTGTANQGEYAQKLFYDNYYFAHQIISKIEGAKFTQEVSLRSFSLFSFPNTAAAGANTSTVKDK